MRPLHCLRQLALTLALVLGWCVVLRGVIGVAYPTSDGPIDTCVANSALATTAPSIVLYEADRLRRPAKHRMVFLGSSNAMLSLRPEDMTRALPGFEVVNLAIPTSNVQQAFQVATLVASVSDEQTLKNTVFVLGIYPGLFAESSSLWKGKPSPLTVEMLRYGLYSERKRDAPEPIFGYRFLGSTKEVYRVLAGVQVFVAAARENAALVAARTPPNLALFRGSKEPPCHYREGPASASTRKKHIKKRARQIGTSSTLAEEQFIMLARLVRMVRKSGARLIITELPTPTWMQRGHFDFYRENKQEFVRKLAAQSRVDYVDLYDALPDDLMGDSTHALREGARVYARAFVDAVRKLEKPLE